MKHYYNEHHPGACDWMEELIRLGAIPAGFIDRRSVEDVRPHDLTGTSQAHFFAGIGGWAHALRLAGHAATPGIWTGSPPCQPWSVGGKKRGFTDPRHLAPQFLDLVAQCRPVWLFGEQVSRAIKMGWAAFVQDALVNAGYIIGFAVLPAAGVGAPHKRERLYFGAYNLAHAYGADDTYANSRGGRTPPPARRQVETVASRIACGTGNDHHVAHVGGAGWQRRLQGRTDTQRQDLHRYAGCNSAVKHVDPLAGFWRGADWVQCTDGGIRPFEPGAFPLVNGFSGDMGRGSDQGAPQALNIFNTAEAGANRLRGYGNAIVPQVAAAFVQSFMEAVNDVV